MCHQTWALIIAAVGALGSIAVAVLAIWGDWFRARFAPAQLVIEPQNLTGDLIEIHRELGEGVEQIEHAYFYHLKVVNKRRWLTPRNCRLLLKAMSKKAPNGEFLPIPLPVPLQFVWAPAEITPPVISIHDEANFDFVTLIKGQATCRLRLYSHTHSFQGWVNAGDTMRYSLQIVADGFISAEYQVFEVAWDGKWSDNREEMQRHLQIREIKSQ